MASKFQFAYDDSHLVLKMPEDQPIDVKTNMWYALDVDLNYEASCPFH